MEDHWRWRRRMAERIASEIDPEVSGVVAIYLIGSTRNACSGPASDIDLLIHFRGSEEQEPNLRSRLGRLADWNHELIRNPKIPFEVQQRSHRVLQNMR